MDYGIYGYLDNQTGDIIYIGKDSNIQTTERDRMHRAPSRKTKIKINEVIQSDPQRYDYVILATFLMEELMIVAEKAFILQYKPEYNKHFNENNKGVIHGGQAEYYKQQKGK